MSNVLRNKTLNKILFLIINDINGHQMADTNWYQRTNYNYFIQRLGWVIE